MSVLAAENRVLRIKDWEGTFETGDTKKKVKKMNWFPCPSGCESNGFLTLSGRGADGFRTLGVFQALCQGYAGKFVWDRAKGVSRDGRFVKRSGKPMSLAEIATLCRVTVEVLEAELAVLEDPDVGWVLWERSDDVRTASALEERRGEENEEIPPNPPAGELGGGVAESSDQESLSLTSEPDFSEEKKPRWEPSPEQRVLNETKRWNRRESTEWSAKELKAWRAVQKRADFVRELALVVRYYRAAIPAEEDIRRRDLQTLLNNWSGEVDRASSFFPDARRPNKGPRETVPLGEDVTRATRALWQREVPWAQLPDAERKEVLAWLQREKGER